VARFISLYVLIKIFLVKKNWGSQKLRGNCIRMSPVTTGLELIDLEGLITIAKKIEAH